MTTTEYCLIVLAACLVIGWYFLRKINEDMD